MRSLRPKRAIQRLLKGLGYQMVRINPVSEQILNLSQKGRVKPLRPKTAIPRLLKGLGYKMVRIRPASEPSSRGEYIPSFMSPLSCNSHPGWALYPSTDRTSLSPGSAVPAKVS